MQKRKKRAFKEHKELIQCLWCIGKGIMFRKHLIKFFTLHGHRKDVVERAIRDLIDSDLIEVFRYGNSHVLKLKKYGIYTLQGKESSDVDSVRISNKKVLRSAFLIEWLLRDLARDLVHLEKGFAHNLGRIQYLKSHVSFEKRSYKILENMQKMDQKSKERKESQRFLKSVALAEIENLKVVREYTENGKRKDEAIAIRREKERNLGYKINLNGLYSRDVYFSFAMHGKQPILYLDFLDLNSTEKKIEDKMKLVLSYINHFFDPAVQIYVNILVPSAIRHDYFKSRIKKMKGNMGRVIDIKNVRMKTINLNLEETLFARMTIIS